jgi:hypothetical protein
MCRISQNIQYQKLKNRFYSLVYSRKGIKQIGFRIKPPKRVSVTTVARRPHFGYYLRLLIGENFSINSSYNPQP